MTRSGEQRALDRRAMLLVVAAAAVVRVAYLATASGTTWETPVLDGDTNLQVARQLLSGWPSEPFWQPPLYPALLSLCLRVSPGLWLPRALAAALSCGTAGLTFALARRALLPRGAAVAAGLLVALHGPLLFYDGELLPTSLGTALATAALWVTLRFPPTPWRGLAAGGLLGLAALAVGPLALLFPALALFTPGRGLARARHGAAVLAGALLITAPVLRHNRAHGGGLALSMNAGIVARAPEARCRGRRTSSQAGCSRGQDQRQGQEEQERAPRAQRSPASPRSVRRGVSETHKVAPRQGPITTSSRLLRARRETENLGVSMEVPATVLRSSPFSNGGGSSPTVPPPASFVSSPNVIPNYPNSARFSNAGRRPFFSTRVQKYPISRACSCSSR